MVASKIFILNCVPSGPKHLQKVDTVLPTHYGKCQTLTHQSWVTEINAVWSLDANETITVDIFDLLLIVAF